MLSTFSGGVNPNDSAFPMDTAGNGPAHETTWTEHVTDISSPDAAGQNTEFEIYMCPSLTLVALCADRSTAFPEATWNIGDPIMSASSTLANTQGHTQ